MKNKTGFGDNRLIGTSREEGWSDSPTTRDTFKIPIHQKSQCALIFPFERGTSFTSDRTMSLSLAKNHAHQSQTSSPVTTIAKRERSFGVDNDFKPRETFVGMYHIDKII